MESFHILTVKYVGPTNNRGSRVKITSDRFKESVTIPYDHAVSGVYNMAESHLKSLGFGIIGFGELKDSYNIISTTFKGLKG